MELEQFEQLITEAVSQLPEAIQQKLNNVGIVVEEGESPNNSLFGLYHGVSQLARGASYGMGGVLPDKITIWKGTIERFALPQGQDLTTLPSRQDLTTLTQGQNPLTLPQDQDLATLSSRQDLSTLQQAQDPLTLPSKQDETTLSQGQELSADQQTEAIRALVRRVVWHEIGHHFGFNEEQIRKLEQKWVDERKI